MAWTEKGIGTVITRRGGESSVKEDVIKRGIKGGGKECSHVMIKKIGR